MDKLLVIAQENASLIWGNQSFTAQDSKEIFALTAANGNLSHNGGRRAAKVGGNHRAGRACNNQPLMGAAKAGGGWQRDQEDDVWQLAMKEDGCHPVTTHSDDGAPLAGRRGSATAVLGSSLRTPSTKTTFNGGVGWVCSMVAAALDSGGDGQQQGHVEVAGAKRGGCRQQTQQLNRDNAGGGGWRRWAYTCNSYNRQWQQWTTVRQWQARAAKTTAGIEGTQQWAAADGGLVGCKVEVAATTTVAMLLRLRRQD